jgi:hypothetical protein
MPTPSNASDSFVRRSISDHDPVLALVWNTYEVGLPPGRVRLDPGGTVDSREDLKLVSITPSGDRSAAAILLQLVVPDAEPAGFRSGVARDEETITPDSIDGLAAGFLLDGIGTPHTVDQDNRTGKSGRDEMDLSISSDTSHERHQRRESETQTEETRR